MKNNESNIPELTDRGHSELLAVYNDTVTVIASFKSQQWRTTNYAILIYVALIGTAKIFKGESSLSALPFAIIILIALLTLLYGLHILNLLENSLIDKRKRLDKIVQVFDKYIQELLFKDSMPASEKITLIVLFRSILIIGFLIDIWILLSWKGCI